MLSLSYYILSIMTARPDILIYAKSFENWNIPMLNLIKIEISLRGGTWVHEIILTSQRVIETPVTKTGQISCHAL